MPGGAPPLMNQPPQIFGGYGPDGLPNMPQMPSDLAAHMFNDPNMLLDDSNEAKRRRIARVSPVPSLLWAPASSAKAHPANQDILPCRLATCVERRRSSAMESFPHARTARHTRPTAHSLKLKRSALPQRGKHQSIQPTCPEETTN